MTGSILKPEDMDFLLNCLEEITILRRDEEKLTGLLNSEHFLSEALFSTTSSIVELILGDYSIEGIESLIAAVRSGKISAGPSREVSVNVR
ncbi:MAG: hypothetical protein M1468_01085 [Candidatus Thermoplasmatota archaeon]|jgi:hypothetical protein|nr:hypothetical protein [Candidatus Thermoplasmatota archaeon]MCL5441243.1 hypothetical protein [Candidatus Thermoplasmatota archaeon]